MRPHLIRGTLLLSLAVAAWPSRAEHMQQVQHVAPAMPKAALTLGAAFAPDGSLWAVQQDPQQPTRMSLQISRDDGRSWSPARLLDTADDAINFGAESNPKLVFGASGVALIAYARPLAQRFTGEIRLLRSTDGGASFAAPVTLHRDRQAIGHGFAALAFDGTGALHTVWLDGRDMAAARQAAAQAGKSQPDYRGAAVYHNVSQDGGASFDPDLKLADASCECCRIAVSPTSAGQVAVLWRQIGAPNIRDHAFAVLDASGTATPPVRASYDNWAVDACPHHGPGLSAAADGAYHAVWFGQRDGVAQVRYGRLDQSGRPQGTVQALPDGHAEHAAIQSAGRKLVIVWRSFDGQAMHLRAWVSEDDGAHFSLRELASSGGDSDYPRLLRKGQQIFVIWNTTEQRHVATF